MITAPPDSPADTVALEQTAAQVRETIVAEDAARTWQGVPLKPWSQERQCLLETLCAADVPQPDISVCNDLNFFHGMFPWAVKALYLATHEPSDWERLRPRLLSVISQWGFEENEDGTPNVPGDTLEDKAAAVTFVMKMINAHKEVMAVRRVKRIGASHESGN